MLRNWVSTLQETGQHNMLGPIRRLPSVGVEEEYQLVDPETGYLSPQGISVMRRVGNLSGSDVQHELHLQQIEMASPVLDTSDQVRECLHKARSALMQAARQGRSALVAAGTNPMPLPDHILITPKPRYLKMEQQYQSLARELIIFGCHVHVDLPDPELGVQLMNFSRPWLPLLQAMSANSPYWHGEDTGYASYRRELWIQWPMSGIPHRFDDLDDYKDCVRCLVQSEAIDDETKIYWDLRLPVKVPTIEFRVCDVQTEIEDCVALVAITRALVMRCELAIHAGEPVPKARHELLRAAIWRAARYGMSGKLIEPLAARSIEAFAHLQQLLEYIDKPLQELGDRQIVDDYVERLRTDGTPAERQRHYLRQSEHQLAGIVQRLIERTSPN